MEEQQKSIDEIFRQSLGDYREAPPAAAWDRISARLDGEEERKRPAFFMRWRWMFMTSIFLTGCTWLLIAKYYNSNPDSHNSTSLAFHKTTNTSSPKQARISENNSHTNSALPLDNQASALTSLNALPAGQKAAHNIHPGRSNSRVTHFDAPSVAPVNTLTGPDRDAGLTQIPGGDQAQDLARTDDRKRDDAGSAMAANLMHDTYVSFAEQKKAGRRNIEPETHTPAIANTDHSNQKVVLAAKLAGTSQSGALQEVPAANIASAKAASAARPAGTIKNESDQPASSILDNKTKGEKDAAAKVFQASATANVHARKTAHGKKQHTTDLAQVAQAPSTQGSQSYEPRIRNRRKKPEAEAAPASQQQDPTGTRVARQRLPVAATKHRTPKQDNQTGQSQPALAATLRDKKPEPVIDRNEKKQDDLRQAAVPMAAQPSDTPKHNRLHVATTPDKNKIITPPVIIAGDTVEIADTTELDNASAPVDAFRPFHPSFSLSALLGYEYGMNSLLRSRLNIGLRLLYHINESLAFGVQPAFRYGSLAATELSQGGTYQRSSQNVTSFTTLDYSPTILGDQDTIYNYVIKETFDSIVVSGSKLAGAFYELELPLIISYKAGKTWNFYGGPTLNFLGKMPGLSGSGEKVYTIVRKDSIAQSVRKPASEFNNYFGTNSSLQPYSNYQAPVIQDPSGLRFGYLLGVDYNLNRLMIGASIRQQLSGYKDLNPDFKKIYSSPYIQLNIGYQLIPQKKKYKRMTSE